MILLNTLGSLDLTGTDGQSLDTILAQPKRTLLLAYLATATPRGYHRRDVLVALFWPELDAERARGALRKALHFLRATLGNAVLTRGDEIALDTSALDSDVAMLERAHAEGRLTDAMALYRGDFLRGVFAKDAPEVERWVQYERARLNALATRTAWTLAEVAVHTDPDTATRWALAAMALTPGDEDALRRSMTLLARTGARAIALRAYDDFADALASDYAGAEPSLITRELRDRLRDDIESPVRPDAAREDAVVESGTLPAAHGWSATDQPIAVPESLTATPSAPARWLAASGLALLALLAVLAILVRVMRPSAADASIAKTASALAARSIAVMPFTIRGGRIEYLREGMVDLLTIGLDGAGDIRPVEPTALLGYLARDSSAGDEVARARAAARRFHAGRFTIGTIVDAGGRLEARVGLYSAVDSSSEPLSVVTASADEAHIVALVDDLTRALVAEMLSARELRLSQIAARTTTSLVALKSYLRGAQAMRTGLYGEATEAFRSAVRADSGFALAYYGLSMAVGWATGGVDRAATIAAEQAVRHARGLSQHDSLLLVAHLHYWSGSVVEAEQEYRRLLVAYPTDAEAWHEFGEVLFHGGAWSGHALRDSRDAFARVRSVGALQVSALTHLARIAAVEHDSLALDSLAAEGDRVAPGDPRVAEIATLRTFVSGDAAARARAIAAAAAQGNRGIWSMSRDIANYAGAWPEAEAVALLLTSSARSQSVRALGWATVAEIRAAAGQPAAARAAAARISAFDASRAASVRGYLASLPFLPAPEAELSAVRQALTHPAGSYQPFGAGSEPALSADGVLILRRSLLAAIDARGGRSAETAVPDTAETIRIHAVGVGMRALLGLGGDTTQARTQVSEMAAHWRTMSSDITPQAENLVRLARAELLHRLGDDVEAVHWYDSFPAYGRDDAAFRAPAALGLARSREAIGDRRGAARAYAEAAWLWRFAEPDLLARARDATARARSLGAR